MKRLLVVLVAIAGAYKCSGQLSTYVGRYVASVSVPGLFDQVAITSDSFYATYFLGDPVRTEYVSGYWHSDAGNVSLPIQILVPSADTSGILWADLSKVPNLRVYMYCKGEPRRTVLLTEGIINVPQLLVEVDSNVYTIFTKGMAGPAESRAACNRALSILMGR